MDNQKVVHLTEKGLHDKTTTGLEREVLTYLKDTGLAYVEELGLNLKILNIAPILKSLEKKKLIDFSTNLGNLVVHDLYHSKTEENLAARVYRDRAKLADEKTRKLYEHIAKEEDVHEREFEQRMKEI